MGTIFAHTPVGLLPPFINISHEAGDKVSVTVRSEMKASGNAGACAQIVLDAETAKAMSEALALHFQPLHASRSVQPSDTDFL